MRTHALLRRAVCPWLVLALGCTANGMGTTMAWDNTDGVFDSSGAADTSSSTGPGVITTASSSSDAIDDGIVDEGPLPPDVPAEDPCPRVRVVSPEPLNVRPDPSTANTELGQVADGTLLEVIDIVEGESIMGNTQWYEVDYLGQSGFVSGVFVQCTLEEPPEPPDGYYVPLPCGMQATVTQGNNGKLSHNGLHAYAFDFGVGLGTPLLAAAAGTVTLVFDETGPGDPCYDGGGPECGPLGNLVIVLHGDGTTTLYKHLSVVQVAPGDEVERGGQIGLSGTTGYSTGRHVHMMRMENCGQYKCQSIPMEFVEAGTPQTGDVVVSQNCP